MILVYNDNRGWLAQTIDGLYFLHLLPLYLKKVNKLRK